VALLQWPGLCEAFPVFFLTTQHLSPLSVVMVTTPLHGRQRYHGHDAVAIETTLLPGRRPRCHDDTAVTMAMTTDLRDSDQIIETEMLSSQPHLSPLSVAMVMTSLPRRRRCHGDDAVAMVAPQSAARARVHRRAIRRRLSSVPSQ